MNETTILIVGLGNPGPFYANTRHQVGQVVVEMLAERLEISMNRKKSVGSDDSSRVLGRWGKSSIFRKNEKREITVQIPTLGINASGKHVANMTAFMLKNAEPAESIIIVHDDMALPFGQIRIKKNSGNDAGHNGIKSLIAEKLEFTQMKIGIGRGRDPLSHALTPFTPEELANLHPILHATASRVYDAAFEREGPTTIDVIDTTGGPGSNDNYGKIKTEFLEYQTR